MPRRSMTYQPQNEKRWWFPVKQALTIVVGGSVSSLLAVDVIPVFRVDKPVETALLVGFSIGTVWLMGAFLDANHPHKLKPQKTPTPSYGMVINDETTVLISKTGEYQKAPIRGGDLQSPFIATIKIDKIRVLAVEIAYKGKSFDTNTWTSNGGGGKGFFNKTTEYLPLRTVFMDHKIVTWKSQRNHANGVLVTPFGMRYFRAVVRENPPPTPAEFDAKFGQDAMELL